MNHCKLVASWVGAFLGAALSGGCGSAVETSEPEASVSQQPLVITVDVRRSLVVTEQSILARFPLQRVLGQLATQSGVSGASALSLFQQWWDTQNPLPGTYAGPHCNDSVDAGGNAQLNGYPYLCRNGAEGAQVSCDPFSANSACAYVPIGLFNRFDKAPENGAHCGEYRVVYAKQSGISSTSDRNLLIFEAVMPNPHPQQGLFGCKPIVDVWADLSKQNNITKRADALEDFYFKGQGIVGPVIDIGNFGDNALGAGQVRTNQFSNTTTGWSLREFKLLRTCSGSTCSAVSFTPVTVKTNPYGPLFTPASTLPAASNFRAFFPTQVGLLGAASVPAIDFAVPDVYNSGQSQASGATAAEMKYLDLLGAAPSTLRSDIQTQLTALGSTLTPDEVVLRAQTQSCAGCHRLDNNVAIGGGLVWPASLGFTHVTERETEVVGGETRFVISPALVNFFLPARQQIFEDFLNNRPHPSKGPTHPLSGSTTHG